MVACASCGTANPDGARFCMACATALAPLDPALATVREERRVVTILFADLAGFTARAEALDPEDVRAFLHPWYALVEREVTGHGGVVERHLGDGVMALFGAPVAHEDDPERAVRASLRIRDGLPRLGLELHARIGVDTIATVTSLGWLVRGTLEAGWLGRSLRALRATEEGIAKLEDARAFRASRGARPRVAVIDTLLASAGADRHGTAEPA